MWQGAEKLSARGRKEKSGDKKVEGAWKRSTRIVRAFVRAERARERERTQILKRDKFAYPKKLLSHTRGFARLCINTFSLYVSFSLSLALLVLFSLRWPASVCTFERPSDTSIRLQLMHCEISRPPRVCVTECLSLSSPVLCVCSAW